MGIFSTWLAERHHRTPVLTFPNALVPVIAQAGTKGITRHELGRAVDLDPQLLDRLLAAFVGIGQLTVSRGNGGLVYRATTGINAFV